MKRGKEELNVPVIILSIFGAVTFLLVVSFVYMSLNGPNYTFEYNQKIQTGEIKNPIQKFALMFSEEPQEIPEGAKVIIVPTEDGEKQIIIQSDLGDFDTSMVEKELVNYGAIILRIYNLHAIPFLGITPKIQIYIDEKGYSIEVIKGDIKIDEGEILKPDLVIRTTNEEIFKMAENSEYSSESISSGRTSIELVANKLVLFSKGYFSLYKEFIG